MSRKTENIFLEINELNRLQNNLESMAKELDNRELMDIQFEMGQRLKSLKFWIESLYLYNGKSTSNAKKNSSRENGKLGGRPPKEITAARKEIVEIEKNILPEIEHSLKMTDDLDEEEKLNQQKLTLTQKIDELKETVAKWQATRIC